MPTDETDPSDRHRRPMVGPVEVDLSDRESGDVISPRAETFIAEATALLAAGRDAEAESLLGSVPALTAFAVSAGDPRVAGVLAELAGLYQKRGRLRDAEVRFREALRIMRQSASDPNETAAVLHNLAVICEAEGRADEARSCWEEAQAVLDGEGSRLGSGSASG